MCNSVRPLAEASAASASPYSGGGSTLERREERPGVIQGKTKLYLRVNSIDDPAVAYLRKVLIMFPGRGQIVFYAQDTQKRYGLPGLIHTSLGREAREVLGEENVVVK